VYGRTGSPADLVTQQEPDETESDTRGEQTGRNPHDPRGRDDESEPDELEDRSQERTHGDASQ
jgi:hypothetical protein